ncbi:MAG: Crp/Fnr family transcriptional regulator [Muribaculaceae bacterium]
MDNTKDFSDGFIRIFPQDISKEFVLDFREHATLLVLEKNEVLPRVIAGRQKIFYILSGSCIRYIINSSCDERAVMFHTESFMPMIGDMYIDDDKSVVGHCIRANEKTSLLCLDQEFGQSWVSRDPVFASFIYSNAIQYLSSLNQFQNHLLGLTSTELYDWLVEKYPFLFKRFLSKDIANFMGVTPVWLSNIKRKALKHNAKKE